MKHERKHVDIKKTFRTREFDCENSETKYYTMTLWKNALRKYLEPSERCEINEYVPGYIMNELMNDLKDGMKILSIIRRVKKNLSYEHKKNTWKLVCNTYVHTTVFKYTLLGKRSTLLCCYYIIWALCK